MKIHRVKITKSIDNNPNNHIFLEMEKDRWFESSGIPTHKAIHDFLKKEKKKKVYHIGFTERYLKIHVKKLLSINPITN